MECQGHSDDARRLGSDDPDGDEFAAFYRAHVDGVMRFMASLGLDAWAAADATAETFLAALKQRRRFDPNRGDAKSWLNGIARHKALDAVRRRQRDQRLIVRLGRQTSSLDQADVLTYQALQRELLSECRSLTTLQRAALEARIVEENSYADVGRRLGVSEVAARQHVSRGLATLRSIITVEEI